MGVDESIPGENGRRRVWADLGKHDFCSGKEDGERLAKGRERNGKIFGRIQRVSQKPKKNRVPRWSAL